LIPTQKDEMFNSYNLGNFISIRFTTERAVVNH